MQDPDFGKIQRNLRRMVQQNAPESLMEQYVRSQGFVNANHFRASLQAKRVLPAQQFGEVQGSAEERARRALNEPIPEARFTPADALRVAGAGVVPGFSDELAGTVRGLVRPGETVEQGIAAEREALQGARERGGAVATALEIGAGTAASIAGGAGLRALGALPPMRAATIGQAARTGAAVGAGQGFLAGAGNADGESPLGRVIAGTQGAAVGGALGGVLSGAGQGIANRAAPIRPDAKIASRVFDPSVTPRNQQRAVSRASALLEEGGVDPNDIRRTVLGGDIEPELPLVLADTPDLVRPGGSARARGVLSEAESQGSRAPGEIRALTRARDVGRVGRRAEQLERATGRPTVEFPDFLDQLTAEKVARTDAAFDAAREAAGDARVDVREIKGILNTETVRNAYAEVLADSPDAVATRVFSSKARPLFNVNGKPLDFVDAETLSRVAQRLKEKIEFAANPLNRAASTNTSEAVLKSASTDITKALETAHPAFRDARETAAFFSARLRAAEEGFKVVPAGKTSPTVVRRAVKPFDKEFRLSDGTVLGNPMDDFRAGFQAREAEILTGRTPPIGGAASNPAPVSKEVRKLVFGPEAAEFLEKADITEESMAFTERATRGLRSAFQSTPRDAIAEGLATGAQGASRDIAIMGLRDPGLIAAAATRLGAPIIRAIRGRGAPARADAISDVLLAGRQGPFQLEDALRLITNERNNPRLRTAQTAAAVFGGLGGGLLGDR